MFGALPQPTHIPCPECGASVVRDALPLHSCDAERLLDFRLFQLRDEIDAFDDQLTAWLRTAAGRFATWIAERDRRTGLGGPPAVSVD
ncbi:MAG TPA: hypothetical protein VNB86_10165 [Gaiellaceae bacterium]|nr:hypothetical protein [Gaiellaceae bacterium]